MTPELERDRAESAPEHEHQQRHVAREGEPNEILDVFVNDATFLDGRFAAFGEVVAGMEVADMIAAAPRDARDNPLARVQILGIDVHEPAQK